MFKQVHTFGSRVKAVPDDSHDESREHEGSDNIHIGASNQIVNTKDILQNAKADNCDKHTTHQNTALQIPICRERQS